MIRLLLNAAICLVCLWGAWNQCAWAQGLRSFSPNFRLSHISVENGLTQGSVYYMLKDSRNFLWFGTQDGLNRYDGHHFRTYRPIVGEHGVPQPGAIRGINIFGIVEDTDGNLWVGTEEGLNRYDRARDRFDCFFATGPDRRPIVSRTMPFFADKTELLYLSDVEGLVRFDYRNHRKTILSSALHPPKEYDLPSSTVRTVDGDIWLHAPKGIIRYNLQTRTVSSYFSNRPDNRFGSEQTIFSFFIDASHIAWLGTSNGLIWFDYEHNTFLNYDKLGNQPLGTVYSIAPDQRGQLWLGTQHNGVVYFDKRSRLFGQVNNSIDGLHRLSEFEVRRIYADNLGIIWANVDPDGLVCIVPDAFLFNGLTKRQSADNLPPDQKLSSYTIRGFLEERFDRLWIVTGDGINVLDPRTNRIVQRYLTSPQLAQESANKLVRSVYRDPQRRIWIGIRGGVMAFMPKTQSFESILFPAGFSQVTDNYVRNMVSINDSTLITATEDGLYALSTTRRKWSKRPDLASQNIFSVYFDSVARQFWAGTYLNGYYCYQVPDKVNAPWTLVRSGLKGSMVLHIRPDTIRKTMWLSTDRGLAALKPASGRIKLYTDQQGLANSFVYGSLSDAQGYVWVSTNRGLSRLDLTTQTIKNFTLSDGLQGNEFNGNAFARLANGEMFFGGVNGFNRFRPDLYHNSSFGPTVHIYSLAINEEPFSQDRYVGEADHIELNYSQNTLSMEFAALDFFSNGQNTYQYQLTNYDDQWVSAGEKNYVRYANLPPGDYVFQVKAANRDGHWSSRIRKLAIHIKPPFWQTLPFNALMALLLGLATFAWIRQRENSIRKQEADRLRLAYDIQEQVKKDIARDLHDEIGTRLATLKLYTTRLVQYISETPAEVTGLTGQVDMADNSSIRILKDNIFALINTTISDVRNLLRKLNPQTLERYGYVAAVEELFSRINATGSISMQLTLVNAPGEPQTMTEELLTDGHSTNKTLKDRLPTDMEVLLYRITQELVSNSLKHANAHQIDLYIHGQPERLLITYSDDGNGFDYDRVREKSTGLGIGSIESRVAILNGKINWQTQVGQGIRVQIELPIGQPKKRRFGQLFT
ncbi:two-component regulator propeller domain-containing protein [Spirosoma sp. SC4-14]|uniref:two-component regulator propeller domain-containing protein n=1 Tax=Spirosoma sp. SC4-14 TaxID=3128900 RepID=UPI0030D1D7CF